MRHAATPFEHWLDAMIPAVHPTNSALARATDVDRAAVTQWRHNGVTPSTPVLMRLAAACGTDPGVLARIVNPPKED